MRNQKFYKFVPWIMSFILVLNWWIFLAPSSVGGPLTLAIGKGKSMEPLLLDGDLLISREQNTYQIGDLILYIRNKGLVIHRIESGNSSTGWKTKGDNKSVEDPWLVTSDQIVGKYVYSISNGGRYASAVSDNPFKFASAIALVTLLTQIPLKRKRYSGILRNSLSNAAKEPRRVGIPGKEYVLLIVSTGSLLIAGCVTLLMLGINRLQTTLGQLMSAATFFCLITSALFIYRLYDGFGVQEPGKSMYALSGRLYLVKGFPQESDFAIRVNSAIELRKIAEKYRLPILHTIDPITSRHTFLVITEKKGMYLWKPPVHSVSRGSSIFEELNK